MSKRPISAADADADADQGQRKRQHIEPNSTPLPVPDLHIATPWISSDISSQLPSLPEISDPEIERAIFTHRGVDKTNNYDRFEWLGDAYLEMISTVLIFQTFRPISAGRGSQLREQLVRNSTLADYFKQYEMGKRTRLPRDLVHLLQAGPHNKEALKIKGDIFEAFVAGVVLSDPTNGVRTTISWLKALWGRTLKDQIIKEEKRRDATTPGEAEPGSGPTHLELPANNKSPKEQLAQCIRVKGVVLRYADMESKKQKIDPNTKLPLFTVGVYLDGWGETDRRLGHGTALSKKEAGQKAATMALENKKLMKVFIEKKKAFMEAQQKAEEESAVNES